MISSLENLLVCHANYLTPLMHHIKSCINKALGILFCRYRTPWEMKRATRQQDFCSSLFPGSISLSFQSSNSSRGIPCATGRTKITRGESQKACWVPPLHSQV